MNSTSRVFESDSHLKNPEGIRVGIVASRFNEQITEKLCDGAAKTLIGRGLEPENIHIYWVPGAYEIPSTCKRILKSSLNMQGLIALGAVIRGDTPHFEYVAGNCASGVMQVSLEYSTPIIFGVLTTDTVEQALNRSGLKRSNKGMESAHALVDLLNLYGNAEI